jgi:hypothetical protein
MKLKSSWIYKVFFIILLPGALFPQEKSSQRNTSALGTPDMPFMEREIDPVLRVHRSRELETLKKITERMQARAKRAEAFRARDALLLLPDVIFEERSVTKVNQYGYAEDESELFVGFRINVHKISTIFDRKQKRKEEKITAKRRIESLYFKAKRAVYSKFNKLDHIMVLKEIMEGTKDVRLQKTLDEQIRQMQASVQDLEIVIEDWLEKMETLVIKLEY